MVSLLILHCELTSVLHCEFTNVLVCKFTNTSLLIEFTYIVFHCELTNSGVDMWQI